VSIKKYGSKKEDNSPAADVRMLIDVSKTLTEKPYRFSAVD